MNFSTAPGGKGANQAVQCSRLGAEVTMVGRVGNDAFGRAMLQAVSDSGVDVSHVGIAQDEPSGVGNITLEVTPQGTNNRIVVCPGANHSITAEHIAWLREEIGNYDMVMMQFELPMEIIELTAQWAFEANVPVMINPAPVSEISAALCSYITYLSPNEHEAALIAGHPLKANENGVNKEDLRKVADILVGKGIKKILITLGANGSIINCEGNLTQIPSVRVLDVVDPTAAGDSFVAAFCTGICAGLTDHDAMTFASHTAAITVSRMGAIPSLPTIEEVYNFMSEQNCTGFDLHALEPLKRRD